MDKEAELEANQKPDNDPAPHAGPKESKSEPASETQRIVVSLLASETERALISLENSKVDLEAKRSANKEHAEAYSAEELKLAELEVAEKEAVLWHAVALLKEATLQKNAGGPTGDAKSLAEAKATVRLAETNIARRRLATLELTQQLNQAANQKTPGSYTSEEMEKLAVEIENAKTRIAELTGGPTEKPQAAKTPGYPVEQQGDLRIATHPGLFEVGDRVFLWVARKLHPDPDENGASLVRVSKEGKQITIDIPIPPGEGTWAAGWVRGGQVLWVAQKGKTTRYDFSDAEQVQTADETQSSKGEAVPKELNALMQQAIREVSSKTDARPDASQGHGSEPASPDEPRASLDPIESPSRRTITWEDLAINATTLADIRDEQMALDEVSEDLKALNGKRIVLRGYMYPTFEATGLTEFFLVSDLYAASFVRKASIDALVGVRLHGKSVTDFVEAREISVEGILRIDPKLEKGRQRSHLYQLYRLEDAQILQLHAGTSMRK